MRFLLLLKDETAMVAIDRPERSIIIFWRGKKRLLYYNFPLTHYIFHNPPPLSDLMSLFKGVMMAVIRT